MSEKVYSLPIEMPATSQEGLTNFVQMIINKLEDGQPGEALLTAVDLRNDLVCEVYKVTMPRAGFTLVVCPSEGQPRSCR